MSNGELYIVAKPQFERNAQGLSQLSIVDVWIVPDNGQGPAPALIGDRRGPGAQTRCGCPDQQANVPQMRPDFQQNFQAQQHLTLVRTPRGWEIRYDNDPRWSPYSNLDQSYQIPRSQQFALDPRWQTQVDPRLQYLNPQEQMRWQRQQAAVDPGFQRWVFEQRYAEMMAQQQQQQFRPQPRRQGRATYGVDPNTGALLDRRNQEMRRQFEGLDQGYAGQQYVPQGRARYGVDPRTANLLAQRDLEIRRQALEMQGYPQQQYQASPMPNDSTPWTAKQHNMRGWGDNLDFDPTGTGVRDSVGNYLNRFSPPRRPGANPNQSGSYAPTWQGAFDSTLRSFGDYIRGR